MRMSLLISTKGLGLITLVSFLWKVWAKFCRKNILSIKKPLLILDVAMYWDLDYFVLSKCTSMKGLMTFSFVIQGSCGKNGVCKVSFY